MAEGCAAHTQRLCAEQLSEIVREIGMADFIGTERAAVEDHARLQRSDHKRFSAIHSSR